MKILGFFAHNDDMDTGMGGTLQWLLAAGHEVVSVIMTSGSREDKIGDRDAKDVRNEEALASHNLLNLEPIFMDFFEQEVAVDPFTRNRFREFVADHKPDAVFTHWGMDTNPDHRATSMLSIEPCLLKSVNIELFCFEVLSGLGRPQMMGFVPSHYVDITDVVERKWEMIRCHKSQSPDQIIEAHTELQKNRGADCGVMHAEAFVRLTRYGELDPGLSLILKKSTWRLPRSIGIEVNPESIGLVT